MVVIIDPVGNTPVFLALTADEQPARRQRFAIQAVLAAAVVIFLFGFFRRDYGAAGLYDINKAGALD